MKKKTKKNPAISTNKQKKDTRFKPGQSGNPKGKIKGTLNKKTVEQKVIQEEFRNRILLNVYDLLTAQMNIAKGSSFLYRVEESKGKVKKRKHILVTDPDEIQNVLDECEGNGTFDDKYYYITTQTPDNRALDSLFDRVLGRATNKVDITTKGESINEESREKAKKAISGFMPEDTGGGQ